MAKNKNPYREGSNYHRIFGFVQDMKGKAFTKTQILDRFVNELDVTDKAGVSGATKHQTGMASVNVVCGPSLDNQGNYSSQGHLYYMNRLPRKTVKDADGKEKKEEQRYQLRWRKEPQVKIRREDAFLTAEQIADRNQRRDAAKAERQAAKEAEATAKAERAEARRIKREEKAAEKEAADKAREQKRKDRKEAADAKEAAKKAKADAREEKRKKRLEDAEAAKKAKEDAKAEKEAAKEVPAETEDAESVSESDGVEAEEGEIAEA